MEKIGINKKILGQKIGLKNVTRKNGEKIGVLSEKT